MDLIFNHPIIFGLVCAFALLCCLTFFIKPSENIVKLCETFNNDQWGIEITKTGRNPALSHHLYWSTLKNFDKDISMKLMFATDIDGRVEYRTSIKVEAPWLGYEDQSYMIRYIRKNKIIDALIYPDANKFKNL